MSSITIDELIGRMEEQQARVDELERRLAAPEAPVSRNQGLGPVSRSGLLKMAALGAVGAGALAVLNDPQAAEASSGPASFKSKTSTAAVTAKNTGSGNAISATAGKGAGVVGKSKTGAGVLGSSGSTAGNATGIQGTITSTNPGGYSSGVSGVNSGTGGSGIGVYGSQNGSGWGVYGTAPSGSGVYGYSSSGYGVQAGSGSGTALYASSTGGVGVDAYSSSAIGVQGTSSSANGVQGNSTSGYGVYGGSPTNYAVVGLTTSGNGVYGQVSTTPQAGVVGRTLDSSGNWAIYGFGNIGATGTKSALVPAADGKGHLTLYCMESPECWFEDFGSAALDKGSAKVMIDAEFAQTIHTAEYYVYLQAEGETRGLYVAGKNPNGFEVREANGGGSDARFSYRIVGRRRDVVAPRLKRAAMPASAALKGPA